MTDGYLVYITTPSEEEAVRLARQLVQERLAACANVVPRMRSFYWWDGKVQDDPEALLLLKTHAQSLQRLLDRARELHSYDVPAINAFRIDQGIPDYLAWLGEETRSG